MNAFLLYTFYVSWICYWILVIIGMVVNLFTLFFMLSTRLLRGRWLSVKDIGKWYFS